MIATITAALMSLYAAVSAQAQNTVRRIHDATISLVSLDRQMMGGVTRTVVPEIMYREYKALYLEQRKDKKPPGGWAAEWGHGGVRGAPALPCGRDGARPSLAGAATKADLRAAVRTILRGEDVSAAKPGPRITPRSGGRSRRRRHTAPPIEAAPCTMRVCARSSPPRTGTRTARRSIALCSEKVTINLTNCHLKNHLQHASTPVFTGVFLFIRIVT